MKKLLTLLILIFAFTAKSQINYYDVEPGQYVIYTVGSGDSITVDRKDNRGGVIAYRNHVGVVDTIFKIPSTAPADTIATLLAVANAIDDSVSVGLLIERGSVKRSTITIPRPNIYIGAYGTGADPIIEGADEIILSGVPKNVTAISNTLNTNAAGTSWRNFRQVYTATQITANGTKFRVKLDGYVSSVVKIGGASVGERSGTTDDYAATPTRLTFSGRDTIDISVGGSVYSDWIDFAVDETKDYIVHVFLNSATTNYKFVDPGGLSYRSNSTSNETLTQTVDYGSSSTSVRIVSAFETSSSTVENLWMKEAVTVQPFITWYNDTIAPLLTDTASLDVNGEWFWDSGTSTYYMYSSVNPNGITDIGQRGILIDASDRDYVTISNLTLQHSNNNNTIGFGSARGALYMYDGSYLTVTGCTIQDNAKHGILVLNSQNITVDNNTLLRNGIMNYNGLNAAISMIAGTGQSIGRYYTFTNNVSSYSGADGFMCNSTNFTYQVKHITISGNTFENNDLTGCYIINSDSSAIFNNTFTNNGAGVGAGEPYSIGVQSGNNVDIYSNTITNTLDNDALQVWASAAAPAHNVRIFKNYISGTTNGNLLELIPSGDQSMLNCKVFSNVFTGCNTIALYFDHTGAGTTADTVDIYNNTFYGNERDIFAAGTATGMPFTLKNNIFGNNSGAASVRAFTGSSITASSNNLWYRSSGDVLNNLGTTYTTATITNFEASAQNTSPSFVNAGAGNFRLQTGSPAINNGVNVGLTTDILGNPIVGNPDIGAYEKQ